MSYVPLLRGSLTELCAQPDIAFSVIKMSQYMANPTKEHIQKVLHIVKYLGSTPLLALSFTGGDSTLDCYCDSDWAGDLKSWHSTSCYSIFMGNDMVSWHSYWQPTVTLSSTEAKYMSMCDCAQQILWIKSLFCECHLTLNHFAMFSDNKGAIHLTQNPVMEGQSKHIDIKYYFLREHVEDNSFVLDYMSTDQQLADIMMKNLTWQKFQENCSRLNLIEFKA